MGGRFNIHTFLCHSQSVYIVLRLHLVQRTQRSVMYKKVLSRPTGLFLPFVNLVVEEKKRKTFEEDNILFSRRSQDAP
jgi:hypothetical protein